MTLSRANRDLQRLGIKRSLTPPKINMEPENWWFVDVSPFPKGCFQVPCLFSGVYFSFSDTKRPFNTPSKTNVEPEKALWNYQTTTFGGFKCYVFCKCKFRSRPTSIHVLHLPPRCKPSEPGIGNEEISEPLSQRTTK